MKKPVLPLSTIVTTDPRHLALIMVPGIKAVLWKRVADPAVVEAIDNFDSQNFLSKERIEADSKTLKGKAWEGGQGCILQGQQKLYPELRALWQERALLHATLKDVFNTTSIFKSPLMIQPAHRYKTDRIFHIDTFYTREKPSFYFLISHKGPATETIPRDDAGRRTPHPEFPAANFFHPKTMKRKLQPEAHDILAIQIGPEGTVHRAPYVRGNARWLTIYTSDTDRVLLPNFNGKLDLS